MDSPEKARSIRLPENVWNALDADAERCRRSSQKQLEAILVTFYGLEDIEVNKNRLEMVGELFPKSKKSIPVLPNAVNEIKKVG